MFDRLFLLRIAVILPALAVSLAVRHLHAQPPASLPPPREEAREFSLDLPTPAELYRAGTEADARAAIRAAAAKRGVRKVEFPTDPDIAFTPPSADRPLHVLTIPPSVVCHRMLYFEDPKTERLGESLGPLEPARSTFLFYGRVLVLPARIIRTPPWAVQCQQHE